MATKKYYYEDNATLEQALEGMRSGKYYKGLANEKGKRFGFEAMAVDISSAPFDIDLRYTVQTVTIPAKKRGNLSKYKGQKVDIICTTVASRGARINFYIRPTPSVIIIHHSITL